MGIDGIEELIAKETCKNCERCKFDPDRVCPREHPKCPICGHCVFRHWPREGELSVLAGDGVENDPGVPKL